MIVFALISAIATSAIVFINTKDSMIKEAQDKLTALLESRKSSLQQYFNTIRHDVQFHAQSPLVINALQHFSDAWKVLPKDKRHYLQDSYINKNPFPIGKKGAFLNADDGSDYSHTHRQYHPVFSNMIEARSFHDLFLLDPQGNLVYTVNKEQNFATNILTGNLKDTQLAQIFKNINNHPQTATMHYTDFIQYKTPVSFIGISVFDSEHQYLGVLIFQLPIEPLNKIMQVTAGMGDSGETYLVGRDQLMRSDSRFLKDHSVLTTKVDTYSVQAALAGNSGIGIINDYRNIPVFSAYTTIDFLQTRWAMIVEVDKSEVLQPIYSISNFLMISGLLITIAISLFGYLLASDIARPIAVMTTIIKRLSKNDLDVNISVDDRKDEVGEMANAMVTLKQNAIEQALLKKQLEYMTEHDILTGINTRGYALEQLDNLIKQAGQTASKLVLMFIDIDNFKQINDIHGHHIGDDILCRVANELKMCIREGDVLARIGGDEFIIILPNIKQIDHSRHIANKIIKAVHSSLPNLDGSNKLTLSIGLSIYPDDATSAPSLLKSADSAMYTVKREGKNNFGYWVQTT